MAWPSASKVIGARVRGADDARAAVVTAGPPQPGRDQQSEPVHGVVVPAVRRRNAALAYRDRWACRVHCGLSGAAGAGQVGVDGVVEAVGLVGVVGRWPGRFRPRPSSWPRTRGQAGVQIGNQRPDRRVGPTVGVWEAVVFVSAGVQRCPAFRVWVDTAGRTPDRGHGNLLRCPRTGGLGRTSAGRETRAGATGGWERPRLSGLAARTLRVPEARTRQSVYPISVVKARSSGASARSSTSARWPPGTTRGTTCTKPVWILPR